MKKITKITIAFVALFCFMISNIEAKEIFQYNWENQKIEAQKETGKTDSDGNPLYKFELADNNYPFKDGYVTGKISLKEKKSSIVLYSYLTKYDSEGKEENSLTINDSIVFSIKSDKDYLYAFIVDLGDLLTEGASNEDYNTSLQIIKINEKMEIVSEIDITEEISEELDNNSNGTLYFYLISLIPKIIGYDNISITDDEIALLYGSENLIVVDKKLKKAKTVSLNERNFKKYFPNKYKMIENIYDYIQEIDEIESEMPSPEDFPESLQISIDSNDTNSVGSGTHFVMGLPSEADEKYGLYIESQTSTDKLDDAGNSQPYFIGLNAFIEYYNSKEKSLWKYESTDYLAFLDTHIINDYVVTIGVNFDMSENISINTDILVFDSEGKIVQTISDGSFYLGLFPSENGFITTKISGINDQLNVIDAIPDTLTSLLSGNFNLLDTIDSEINDVEPYEAIDVTIETNNVVYNLLNKIETKVEGKGTIEVIDASKTGEKVTFKVTPEKGYVLKSIKVTDKDGKTVIFTDYTFTMPSSDVVIEAIFVTENPETSSFIILSAIAIAIIGGAIFIYNKKKLNWLK